MSASTLQLLQPIRKPDQGIELIPQHWATPKGRVGSAFFKLLCIASFGRSTLQYTWEVIQPGNDAAWKEEKEALIARMNNMTVIGGLLMTTMVVILSTKPPDATAPLFDWTKHLPYLCILVSFTPTLGAVIVGAMLGLAFAAVQPDYVRDMCSSRRRVVCLLYVIAYPFLTLSAATLIFAAGLVSAAWLAGYKPIVAGSIISLVLPISVAPIFISVVYIPATKQSKSLPYHAVHHLPLAMHRQPVLDTSTVRRTSVPSTPHTLPASPR